MAERMRKRCLRAAAVAVLAALALVLTVVPANGAKGGRGGAGGSGGTSTSITFGASEWASDNSCAFDATYSWTGVKGKNLSLAVQLIDGTGAVLKSAPRVDQLSGSGTFTFTFWFTGAAGPARSVLVRGALLSNGVEVDGTAATSTVLSTNCGSPINVSWVFTVPLT